MKKSVLVFITVLFLAATVSLGAEKNTGKYAEYFAGVQVLVSNKTIPQKDRACSYKKLCALSGVNAGLAAKFIRSYADDPAGWQKFQQSVAELLQHKKDSKG
jgi:hypothetical protein